MTETRCFTSHTENRKPLPCRVVNSVWDVAFFVGTQVETAISNPRRAISSFKTRLASLVRALASLAMERSSPSVLSA